MRFITTALTSLALLAAPIFGAPEVLKTVAKFDGETTGRFIVKLKDGASKTSLINQHNVKTTHDWEILNGFAGEFDDATLNALRASPDVELIEEDGIMHTFAKVTQTNAPWGIARLSQTARLSSQSTNSLTFTNTYDSSAGAGVDIFIVDTGVLTTHSQFGGRARWGATFGGYASERRWEWHGTHCAGTAAGSQFGVAKAANIVAVKVLSDAALVLYLICIVSGLNFALTTARSSGRPSVVSMSLGGSASTALDNAIASLTSAGVHVSLKRGDLKVAAGNDNADAGTTSPARAPSANTVGATTIADARASFSNFGSVVDIFAPGQDIISSWIGSNSATNIISGTSMATPHVAGLIAYLIGLNGNVSPASMSTNLKSLSLKSVISGIPSGTLNDFAHHT
ncbi:serine protease [Infundibulicybe gibba]|nr:serine protease [Infundibulicybe gibba]